MPDKRLKNHAFWTSPQAAAAAKASSMMPRMVRAQRPHCALQPRQPYTLHVEGLEWAVVLTAARTSWSVITLQEQTIMDVPAAVFAFR